MSIEPVLDVFEFGSPSFDRLVSRLRAGVNAEAVEAGLPGLVFTIVWALDAPADAALIEELIAPVVGSGDRVDFVELVAPLETCVAREGTENRLAHKRSKTDVDWAVANNREMHASHVFNTADDFPLPHPHWVVDNSGTSPTDAAARIIDLLGLASNA